jgi:hypothetical protein
VGLAGSLQTIGGHSSKPLGVLFESRLKFRKYRVYIVGVGGVDRLTAELTDTVFQPTTHNSIRVPQYPRLFDTVHYLGSP